MVILLIYNFQLVTILWFDCFIYMIDVFYLINYTYILLDMIELFYLFIRSDRFIIVFLIILEYFILLSDNDNSLIWLSLDDFTCLDIYLCHLSDYEHAYNHSLICNTNLNNITKYKIHRILWISNNTYAFM